ncbi:uncharacterized protein LOC107035960 [Diachasma alloeum]|uniref:Odorant receptor n=1 Tax=Diachasma alloeum TaxID=454923 RepID=A0A4E0RMF2_9HYME|nr:uncharacterized protein LOC107035960 [Diachasma alloeum]THK32938.1 odorant receptor 46 [Diachasma alloeum]
MENNLSGRNRAADVERKHFDWEVGITKPVLKLIGLWPGGQHQTFLFIVNEFMQIYLFSVFLASIVLEPSVTSKIDKIFVWLGIVLIVVDHNIFRAQWHNIKPLIECIQQNWREFDGLSADIKGIMVSYGGLERRITRCIYFVSGVSLIVFTLQPILIHLAFPSKFPLAHPNNARHPFNASVSPMFEITYVIQYVFHCSAALIFSSIDCCIIWLIFHCCGQLEILANVISHYKGIRHHTSDSVDDEKRVIMGCSCLHCIVNYHLRIFKMISLFDDAFHVVMFARMIICTGHFICIGYTIRKLKEDGNFIFLVVNVFFLFTMDSSFFIYCWLGDKLKEKSINIGYTAFHQHISSKKKVSKDLIMIIRQAQIRPCHITAAKFFVMSLELFKEYVLKSMSYLSVLVALRVNDKS